MTRAGAFAAKFHDEALAREVAAGADLPGK